MNKDGFDTLDAVHCLAFYKRIHLFDFNHVFLFCVGVLCKSYEIWKIAGI